MEGEVPSSVTGNYAQIKDPLLLPQQPLHQHGNTIATSHTSGSVTTTTSLEQPRLSLPPSLVQTSQEQPPPPPPPDRMVAQNVSKHLLLLYIFGFTRVKR